MQKLVTFLWFDHNAEEAIEFYTSIFQNARLISTTRYGDAGPGPKGSIMSASFELEGQTFYAINGGPHFKFNEAISIFVNCKTQAEVDTLWEKLGEGGTPQMCGWMKDKFGLSWQIVPTVLNEMLSDEDAEKANRVMLAMMKMVKIDIAALEKAYAGK